MSIIETATRRRVAVSMAAVALLLFGLIALGELKVNLLPELSYPTLTVRTEYQGAAPAEIETLVSRPVEESLGVVENVVTIRSVSRANQSDVILEFAWGTDMDYAALDVREKLEALQLPLEADRPLLLRFNPATDPIMRAGLAMESGTNDAGDGFSERQLKRLRRHGEEELKKGLESVVGVAAVKISGGLEDEIEIGVDQDKLGQLGLSIGDIAQRLEAENVNLSGGQLETGGQRFLVRTLNQFESVEDMRRLVVAVQDRRPVYLEDVAEVKQGFHEREAIIRLDGQEAVEIAIYKEGDANTVTVARAVSDRLDTLRDELPDGMSLVTVDDQSTFISQAIGNVVSAALLGGALAILVLYVFLGNAWSTIIIAISIPLSIVTTFFLMYSADISLNIMSLGGIALAAGLLVDNGIVVLENIARHREMGRDARESAVKGAGEVGQAVTAATLTTVAVFFPLVFVEGIGGQLFRDQALTVTFALLISLAVALTLIPMMASLSPGSRETFADEALPPAREPRTRFGRGMRALRRGIFTVAPAVIARLGYWLSRGIAWLGRTLLKPLATGVQRGHGRLLAGYQRLLPWALGHRAVVLGVAALLFAGSLAMLPRLGMELIPQLAQGRFNVELTLQPGTPLEGTDSTVRAFQQHAMKVEGVETVYAVSGTGNRLDASRTETGENIGSVLVVLAPDASEADVMDALRTYAEGRPGLKARFTRPELFSLDTPLAVEIAGYDLDRLREASERVVSRLESSDRYADVETSMAEGHPEIRITFDPERAAQLGLTVRELADRVVSKVRGDVATRYDFRDRKIDVLVRARESDRASVAQLEQLIVNPQSQQPVPLESVADMTVTEGPAEIRRSDQERVALVTANLRYGDLASAAADARSLLGDVPRPPGISLDVVGQNEEMERSYQSLLFALGLAVFLVYLVMASQFESLLHPFVILFSIPLSLVGVVLALLVTGSQVSILVFIGIIMLAGIVVNNAIVLVDLINQLREQGFEREKAVLEAGHARLRPILMTMLTTVLGLLPLAIGIGSGSEVRAPMAITVIGGLLLSTLLTLVVVPVMYMLLDRGDPEPEGVPEPAE